MYVDMHNEAEARVGYILYSWCSQWNESSSDKLDPCLAPCRFGDKFRFFKIRAKIEIKEHLWVHLTWWTSLPLTGMCVGSAFHFGLFSVKMLLLTLKSTLEFKLPTINLALSPPAQWIKDSAPYFGRWTQVELALGKKRVGGLRSVGDLHDVITAASRPPSSS